VQVAIDDGEANTRRSKPSVIVVGIGCEVAATDIRVVR